MQEPRERFTPSFSFGRKGRRAVPSPPPDEPPARPAGAPAPGNFRQWAGATHATLAMVFTDIVSSSALGNKLGNRAMDALRRAHFARAADLARRYGGYVVKTMGDSVMAAFRAAGDALDFALALHADPGDRRVRIRAGVHVGPVSIQDADAHGASVNYAARVVGAPDGAEVWLSSEAKSHVDQQGAAHHAELPWLPHAGMQLKGFPGKHVLWSFVLR